MKLKVKLQGEFGHWLGKRLKENRIKVYDLAEDIHISPKIIYRHLKGESKPTFPYIAAYCCYFNELGFEKNNAFEVFYKYVEKV